MLFQFLKLRKMTREGMENPAKLAAEEASGFIVGALIVPFIIALVLLVTFFALGFTDWFFGWGPFGFFKTLFYIGLGLTGVASGIAYGIIKVVKRSTRKTVQTIKDIGVDTRLER